MILITGVAFSTTPLPAQRIEFADVVFQLSAVTQRMYQEELVRLESNPAFKQENFQYLSVLLPEMSQFLAEEAVPDDFKFLVDYKKYQKSVTEEEILPEGVFWCMDEGKSQEMGLLSNDEIDERRHLYTVTEAALMCLRRNKVLLNNWGSVLFAHLVGEQVLSQLEIRNHWRDLNIISLDSPAFAPLIEFLAYKHFCEKSVQESQNSVEHFLYAFPYVEGLTLKELSVALQVEYHELKKFNHWALNDSLSSNAYPVVVCAKIDRYHELEQLKHAMSIKDGSDLPFLGFPTLSADASIDVGHGGSFYRINSKKGVLAEFCDNFVNLAYKGGITPEAFLKYNEITSKTAIQVGKVYYLEPKDKKGPIPFHTVMPYQSIWDIAHSYGVQISSILKLNRLESAYRLQAGRVINLQDKIARKAPIKYEDIEVTPLDKKIESSIPSLIDEEPKVAKQTVKVIEEEVTYVQSDFEIVPVEAEAVIVSKEPSYTASIKSQILQQEGKFMVHQVQNGETLKSIAERYQVPVRQLFNLNKLTSSNITTNEKIKIKKI